MGRGVEIGIYVHSTSLILQYRAGSKGCLSYKDVTGMATVAASLPPGRAEHAYAMLIPLSKEDAMFRRRGNGIIGLFVVIVVIVLVLRLLNIL